MAAIDRLPPALAERARSVRSSSRSVVVHGARVRTWRQAGERERPSWDGASCWAKQTHCPGQATPRSVSPPNCEWWLLLKKQIFHEASMLMSRVQVPLSLTAEWTRRDSGTCAGWPG